MSVIDKRTQFRNQLSILTSDIENFDNHKESVSVATYDFVKSVESYIATTPPPHDLNALISPDVDANIFNNLYPQVRKHFLADDSWRTDKIALFSDNEVIMLDANTGTILNRKTMHSIGGRSSNTATYKDGRLQFIGREEAGDIKVIQIDPDSLETILTSDMDMETLPNHYLYHDNHHYIHKNREFEVYSNDGKFINSIPLVNRVVAQLSPHSNSTVICNTSHGRITYANQDLSEFINITAAGNPQLGQYVWAVDHTIDNRVIFTESSFTRISRIILDDVTIDYQSNGSNSLRGMPRTMCVGPNDRIYVRELNTIRQLNQSFNRVGEFLDIPLSGTVANHAFNYSDDDYLYIYTDSLIYKVDVVDMTIVWELNVEDVGVPTFKGLQLLRPQGGINYVNAAYS